MFRRGRKRRGRHGEDEEEKETVEEEEAKGRKLKEEKRCTHRQLCMMEVYSVGSCTRRACVVTCVAQVLRANVVWHARED
ncbi:hypothetical protein GW17_00059439 [Ensete ventricosum]|nr:hypothetical protein GW17_00059439 [Ensete ventricosum]